MTRVVMPGLADLGQGQHELYGDDRLWDLDDLVRLINLVQHLEK